MPIIIEYNPLNIAQVLNMFNTIDAIDKRHMEKGELFVTAMFVIYSL